MIFALTCVSCGAGVLNGPAVVYAPEPGTFFIVAAGLALVTALVWFTPVVTRLLRGKRPVPA